MNLNQFSLIKFIKIKNINRNYIKLIQILIFGILIRISISIYSSWADTSVFASYSVTMLYGGIYDRTLLTVYPPIWIYFLNIIGKITNFLIPPYNILYSNSYLVYISTIDSMFNYYIVNPIYLIIEKSFLSIFDILDSFLIFYIVYEFTKDFKKSLMGFTLFFLNPLTIFISSMHGTFDLIAVFFTLSSFYFTLKKKPFFSGISLGLGIATKYYDIFLIFLIIAMMIKTFKMPRKSLIKNLFVFIIGVIFAIIIIYTPVIFSLGITNFLNIAKTPLTTGQNFNGFNEWSIFNIPGLSSIQLWLNIHYSLLIDILLLITITSIIFIALMYYKLPNSDNKVLLYSFSLSIIFIYFFIPVVQPQYTSWILPFLILIFVLYNELSLELIVFSVFPVLFYLFGLSGPLSWFPEFFTFTKFNNYYILIQSIKFWLSIRTYEIYLMLIPVFLIQVLIIFKYAFLIYKSKKVSK